MTTETASWLGSLPSHWASTKLKRVVQATRPITYGIVQAGPMVEGGIPYIRPADMTDEKGVADADGILRTSEEIAGAYRRSSICAGDLVCSIGPSFGKVMLVPDELDGANLTQGTARVAIQAQHSPRYYFWVLRSNISYAQWESSVGGATFRALNLEPLAETIVPEPPRAEQTAIAAFLDRETGKIDTLVEEQRRLIELLNEKRQAVISQAVTKGLNPNAKMKPSGVEWLGDVPEHWEVKAVGAACSYLSYGFTNPMPTADEGPFMLTANDVQDGFVDFDGARQTTQEAFDDLTAKSRPLSGDVLVTKDGTLGRVALFDGPVACINQSVALLRPDVGTHPAFLALCLRGGVYQDRMVYEAGGTTIKHIYISRLAKMPLARPPLPEQVEITEHLAVVCRRFDQLSAEAEKAIDLLVERRAALISAAVTGKIDVVTTTTEEAAA